MPSEIAIHRIAGWNGGCLVARPYRARAPVAQNLHAAFQNLIENLQSVFKKLQSLHAKDAFSSRARAQALETILGVSPASAWEASVLPAVLKALKRAPDAALALLPMTLRAVCVALPPVAANARASEEVGLKGVARTGRRRAGGGGGEVAATRQMGSRGTGDREAEGGGG
eukprot:1095097-Pleurochrysis_carterae.AAC.1